MQEEDNKSEEQPTNDGQGVHRQGVHCQGVHSQAKRTASDNKRLNLIASKAPLPSWEVRLYLVYFVTAYAYGAYNLFLHSKALESGPNNEKLEKSWAWSIFGRLRDGADVVWTIWRSAYKMLAVTGMCHVVLSIIVTRFAYQYRRHAWLAVGVLSVYFILGWKSLLFITVMGSFLFCASTTGNVLLTWVVAIGFLATLDYDASQWMVEIVSDDDDDDIVDLRYSLLYISSAFYILRFLSFAIEKAKRINGSSRLSEEVTFSLFDALVYSFYVPNFYTGPVFIYKYFQIQVVQTPKSWSHQKILHIILKAIRSFFIVFIIEFGLHFFYIHALVELPDELWSMNLWSLMGTVLYFGILYQTIHVVTYGFAGSIMLTDRIVPPANPKCLVRVAYYSDIWRYFDPGLNAFFTNYVYIAVGGSRYGLARQIFATAVTFTVVFGWHGAHSTHIIPGVVNLMGVLLEKTGSTLAKTSTVENFQTTYLGVQMSRRVHAALNVPLAMAYIFSSMAFLTGVDNSIIYIDRFVLHCTPLSFAIMYFQFYAMTIFSQEVELWEAGGHTKVKDQ